MPSCETGTPASRERPGSTSAEALGKLASEPIVAASPEPASPASAASTEATEPASPASAAALVFLSSWSLGSDFYILDNPGCVSALRLKNLATDGVCAGADRGAATAGFDRGASDRAAFKSSATFLSSSSWICKKTKHCSRAWRLTSAADVPSGRRPLV